MVVPKCADERWHRTFVTKLPDRANNKGASFIIRFMIERRREELDGLAWHISKHANDIFAVGTAQILDQLSYSIFKRSGHMPDWQRPRFSRGSLAAPRVRSGRDESRPHLRVEPYLGSMTL